MQKNLLLAVYLFLGTLGVQGQSYFISFSDSLQWPAFSKISTTHDSWIMMWFHDNSHPESIELNNSPYFDDFEKVFDPKGLPLLVDLQEKSMSSWSQHFGINDAPVIVFLRGGRVYHKIEGIPQQTFDQDYKKAQYNYSKYPIWQGEFSKDGIETFHLMQLIYVEFYNQNQLALNTLIPKMQLQVTDEDLSNTQLWPYFLDFGLDASSALFLTLRDHPELTQSPGDTFPRLAYAERALNFNITNRSLSIDSLSIPWLSEEIIYPLVADSSESTAMELALWQEFLIGKKRWKTYRKITEIHLTEYPSAQSVIDQVDKALSLNYTLFKESCFDWIRLGLQAKKNTGLYIRQAYLELNSGDYTSATISAQLAYQYAYTPQEKKQVDRLMSNLFGN